MRYITNRRLSALCLLTILGALCSATTLSAATITVTNSADSGLGSLRSAMLAAQENDTITFADNVRGTIQVEAALPFITTTLTIVGPGANLLTIDGVNVPTPPPGAYSPSLISVSAPGHAVSISGLTFANGRSYAPHNSGGGAMWNNGNLSLIDCVITSCITFGPPAGGGYSSVIGGAIFNTGSLEMVGCTLSGNKSQGGNGAYYHAIGGNGYGGALANRAGGTAILRNCTITGNQALPGRGGCFNGSDICSPSGDGGAGAIDSQGALTVESCTIVSNLATNHGGGVVVNFGGTARFANTIVAKNTAPIQPDFFVDAASNSSIISDGFNLIGNSDDSTGFTAIGDQTGTLAAPIDPLVGPLQDNGGPTATMALLPGSPALDKGNAATVATDQRGSRRRDDFPNTQNVAGGDASDIGAFELRHASLLNVSTRARVLLGDDALIAGFIITPGHVKQMIVRGIGTSLPIQGHLADPTIQVYDNHGDPIPTAFNDNWMDAISATEIEETLPPTNPLESALWGIISPTEYSLILRGRDNTTGIGVVEAYDLDPSADSGLRNISTRGFVGTGDEVMICGLIIGPAEFSIETRVALRAIGPSLTQFGVSNAVANPSIDVRDSNGDQVAFNDDWQNDPNANALVELGLAPEDSLESATIITASSGAFTAIVRGVGDGTGVGLVEAYEVGPE